MRNKRVRELERYRELLPPPPPLQKKYLNYTLGTERGLLEDVRGSLRIGMVLQVWFPRKQTLSQRLILRLQDQHMWKNKGSRTGQREKLNCNSVTTKMWVDPMVGCWEGLSRVVSP